MKGYNGVTNLLPCSLRPPTIVDIFFKNLSVRYYLLFLDIINPVFDPFRSIFDRGILLPPNWEALNIFSFMFIPFKFVGFSLLHQASHLGKPQLRTVVFDFPRFNIGFSEV